MSQNPRNLIAPLDWSALVREAIRRRKSEGLTQKRHASLAGVSMPTLRAFDRAETKLRLSKAIDILRVVGLVTELEPMTDQDSFVAAARERWLSLVESLSDDAPARQSYGYYASDYEIVGDIRSRTNREFLDDLRQAVVRLTGVPPFGIPTRTGSEPAPYDDVIELWAGESDEERTFEGAAHGDFWWASKDGRLYLQRGYQEDVVDQVKPGTIFDLTLPIWRAGEALLHAASLTRILATDSATAKIRFRLRYTGLAARELVSWIKAPGRRLEFMDVHRARTEEVTVSTETSADEIDKNLPDVVHRLLAPLYERFDFFELTPDFVEREIAELRQPR